MTMLGWKWDVVTLLMFAALCVGFAELVSCSQPALPSPASPSAADVAHKARLAKAFASGVTSHCPSTDEACVDDYGLVWSRCAWENVGSDKEQRDYMDKAAEKIDPLKSWLIECDELPPGMVHI